MLTDNTKMVQQNNISYPSCCITSQLAVFINEHSDVGLVSVAAKKVSNRPKTNCLHNPYPNLHQHRAVLLATARSSCLFVREHKIRLISRETLNLRCKLRRYYTRSMPLHGFQLQDSFYPWISISTASLLKLQQRIVVMYKKV